MQKLFVSAEEAGSKYMFKLIIGNTKFDYVA